MPSCGCSYDFIDKKTHRGLFAYTVVAILSTVCQICIPYSMGLVIDGLISNEYLISRFSFLLVFAVTFLLFEQYSLSLVANLANQWKVSMRIRLLSAWGLQEPGEAEKWTQGEAGMKFMRDIPILGDALQNVFPQLLQTVLMFVFAVAVAFWQCWQIGVLILLAIPAMLLIHLCFNNRFHILAHQSRMVQDDLCAKVFEYLNSYSELKALNAERHCQDKVSKHLTEISSVEYANTTNRIAFQRCFAILLLMCEYATLGVACYLASHGRLAVGQIVFFQVMIMRVLNSGVGVLQLLPQLAGVREARDSIQALLCTEDMKSDNADKASIGRHIETLDLSGVSFIYPGSQRKILNDFSMHIDRGEVIALEGVNGIGKTTLWKIITGWLVPTQGTVTVNGHDLQVCLEDYRSRISFVTQHVLLFYGTLTENITLGEPNPCQNRLENALRISGFDKVAERFPDGLERHIENNSGLSGGECQRLALARALYRSPELLVLDEVTNHMDTTGKEIVKGLIKELRGKATVLVISHEVDVRALCDREIVLK